MFIINDDQIVNHEEHEIKIITDDAEEQYLMYCFDCENILDSMWIEEIMVSNE